MKLKCDMNRLDWYGNPGSTVRRGEVFEIDDPNRVETWLQHKYVTEIIEDGAPIVPIIFNDINAVESDSQWDNSIGTETPVKKPKTGKRGR